MSFSWRSSCAFPVPVIHHTCVVLSAWSNFQYTGREAQPVRAGYETRAFQTRVRLKISGNVANLSDRKFETRKFSWQWSKNDLAKKDCAVSSPFVPYWPPILDQSVYWLCRRSFWQSSVQNRSSCDIAKNVPDHVKILDVTEQAEHCAR